MNNIISTLAVETRPNFSPFRSVVFLRCEKFGLGTRLITEWRDYIMEWRDYITRYRSKQLDNLIG